MQGAIHCGSKTLWGWHTTSWIVLMPLVPCLMLLMTHQPHLLHHQPWRLYRCNTFSILHGVQKWAWAGWGRLRATGYNIAIRCDMFGAGWRCHHHAVATHEAHNLRKQLLHASMYCLDGCTRTCPSQVCDPLHTALPGMQTMTARYCVSATPQRLLLCVSMLLQ